MTLDAGLFCIVQTSGAGADAPTGLPGVRVSLPPGPRRPAGGGDHQHASATMAGCSGGGDAALVRVLGGPAQVLVTVYQSPNADAATAPNLQVIRLLDAAAARQAARAAGARRRRPPAQVVDVLAHIQGRGDVGARARRLARRAGQQALDRGLRGGAERRRRPPTTSNTRRCSAAAGCRPGSRAASSAAAAAWRCRCSACGCGCAAQRRRDIRVPLLRQLHRRHQRRPGAGAARPARPKAWRRWRRSRSSSARARPAKPKRRQRTSPDPPGRPPGAPAGKPRRGGTGSRSRPHRKRRRRPIRAAAEPTPRRSGLCPRLIGRGPTSEGAAPRLSRLPAEIARAIPVRPPELSGQYLHCRPAPAGGPGERDRLHLGTEPQQHARRAAGDLPEAGARTARRASEHRATSTRPSAAPRRRRGLARNMRSLGFTPDIIIGHHGWGEMLDLVDVWPGTPMLGYFEFYYQTDGQDVGFDPEFPIDAGPVSAHPRDEHRQPAGARARTSTARRRRSGSAPAIPTWAQAQIGVLPEGARLDVCSPIRSCARRALHARPTSWCSRARSWSRYVARNLEPYRGFHVMMRALPDLLAARPDVKVVHGRRRRRQLRRAPGQAAPGGRISSANWPANTMPRGCCCPGSCPIPTICACCSGRTRMCI